MKKLQKISAYHKVVLVALASLLLIVSCKKGEESPKVPDMDDFISKQEAGLFGYGGFLLKYTPQECQIAVNVKRRQVRIQNDNQTNWINVHFSKFPFQTNEEIELELRYMSGGDEIVHTTVMETVKASDNKFWLWDQTKNMGIIVPLCW